MRQENLKEQLIRLLRLERLDNVNVLIYKFSSTISFSERDFDSLEKFINCFRSGAEESQRFLSSELGNALLKIEEIL